MSTQVEEDAYFRLILLDSRGSLLIYFFNCLTILSLERPLSNDRDCETFEEKYLIANSDVIFSPSYFFLMFKEKR